MDKDIIVGTTSGSRSRGRLRRRWIDWTELKINNAAESAETGVNGMNWSIVSGMAHYMT